MSGNFPPDFFAPDYWAPDYFGGEANANAISASIAGVASVSANLTSAAVVTQLRTEGGNGALWRLYQEIFAAEMRKAPKKRRKKVAEPVVGLPIGGLDGLRAEIEAEKAAIETLKLRERRQREARIAFLAAQERALIAAHAEMQRRKRNNETALAMLLAA